MKLPVEKEFRHDLEIERDKRLMRIVAYAMNDGLRTFPVNHARRSEEHTSELQSH